GLAPPHLPPSLTHLSVPEIVLIASFAVLFFGIIMILLLYLNSICRFILFDSVIKRDCTLRESWRRWRPAGRRFFVWQLLFQVVLAMGFVILVGLPLGFAYMAGWLAESKQHLAPLILGGILLFFVFVLFISFIMLVHVLAKDFVVPVVIACLIPTIRGGPGVWNVYTITLAVVVGSVVFVMESAAISHMSVP